MRILITGGAGFIGSNLADKLLARGDDILVIDNFTTGRRDNLPKTGRIAVEEGTIADCEWVGGIVRSFGPDTVVHAAASYKDPENWAEDARTNVLGTVNVVRACEAAGARRLIYFQTSLCYGLRPREQPITLKHPVRAEGSSYAISKTAGEQYIMLSKLDYLSFRLANVYGPRNLSGPLPTFYMRLTTGKPCFVVDTRRDFIFVQDLVDVVARAIDGKGRRGVYHVATGSDYAIKDLLVAVLKALGRQVPAIEVRPRNEDDVYTILLDPSETALDFEWRATTRLEDGVRQAVEWYKTHPFGQTFTHLKEVQVASDPRPVR
ncbi:MAG: NAD-dependent epimerase/dehydratase family protein [Verrucomicrobiota bacterium]|nr:NAD-dependent epimerase/dehydratase family protein [Verrucomicrobiota bacterium]